MSDRLHVLHTVRDTADASNPFGRLLLGALPRAIASSTFSWTRFWLGRQDVIHFQWPERLVVAGQTWKSCVKAIAFAIGLSIARLRRTGIVLTVHNLDTHEVLSAPGRWAMRLLEQRVHLWILLTSAEETGHPAARTVVIPHGDYRSIIAVSRPHARPGSGMTYFGLIRGYKGVPELIKTFDTIKDRPDVGPLRVLGKPWSIEVERLVVESAAAVPDVDLRLRHIPDEELFTTILESRVTVLPYERLYNSGAIMMSLSLSTPVIVPRTATTEELAEQFGEDWILLYDPPLEPEKLVALYHKVRPAESRTHLDLTERDWAQLGHAYERAYRTAKVLAS